MNDYEKELYEEFGQGGSPLEGLEIYLTSYLKKSIEAIEVLRESYQEDLFEMPMEERTKANIEKKEEAFFYMLDCIKQRICYKFNGAQEGYISFCDHEDAKMEARGMRYKRKQEVEKQEDDQE